METHRTSVSTRRRFGYIIALVLFLAWSGIATPIYSQNRQEVLKVYSAEEWKGFLEAREFLVRRIANMVYHLDYLGEIDRPLSVMN